MQKRNDLKVPSFIIVIILKADVSTSTYTYIHWLFYEDNSANRVSISPYNLTGINSHNASNLNGDVVCVCTVYDLKHISKERKKQLGGPDNLLWISVNIWRSTTRLNTPAFPRGAGSLEQGHECSKSRGKKQQQKTGQWAGTVADKMAIRKVRIKVGSLWLNRMINKHGGERGWRKEGRSEKNDDRSIRKGSFLHFCFKQWAFSGFTGPNPTSDTVTMN